jgi:N-acetylglucosamine malate deacetylase 1
LSVDVLAVGAHPDDVEVGIGGLVRKLTDDGRRVAILDLTRGEMGSRGSVRERKEEARNAAGVLGAVCRESVRLPDGALCNSAEQQRAIIPFLRKFQPDVILAPMRGDLHPDHEAAHYLVRDANHFAGLAKLDPESEWEPWRAPRVYYYSVYREPALPALIVDVTRQFDLKVEALRAYRSQFHNPDYEGPETYIASEQFWEAMRARAAYWGTRLVSIHGVNQHTADQVNKGVLYGECLFSDVPIAVDVLPGLEKTG